MYESMFGNTRELAGEVMAGLVAAGAQVDMAEVVDTSDLDLSTSDLLVLAAPTHALTLSRPASRAEAVGRGAEPARAATGVREWLASMDVSMPASGRRPIVAVFDTRISKMRHMPGSAARSAAKILNKAGLTVVSRTSFYVDEINGPISPGEGERARLWGRKLASGATVPDDATYGGRVRVPGL
ncbi:MAG TPA: hypothetical protein VLI04_23580 [Nocardioidaceae bacterium]|nr:hypothetical protein [Nocardioidaceae bacterium]